MTQPLLGSEVVGGTETYRTNRIRIKRDYTRGLGSAAEYYPRPLSTYSFQVKTRCFSTKKGKITFEKLSTFTSYL